MLDLLAGWIHQLLYHFDDISGIDFHCGIHVQHSMVKEIFHSGGCSLVVQCVWSNRKNFVHCHFLAQEDSHWQVWIPWHLYATDRLDTTLYALQCQTRFQNIATDHRVWNTKQILSKIEVARFAMNIATSNLRVLSILFMCRLGRTFPFVLWWERWPWV